MGSASRKAYLGERQSHGFCSPLLSMQLRLIYARSDKVPQLLLDLAGQALLQLSLCSFCLQQNRFCSVPSSIDRFWII